MPVELAEYTDEDFWLIEALELDPDVMRHLGGPIDRERLQVVHRRRLGDPWWLKVTLDFVYAGRTLRCNVWALDLAP